MPGPGKRKSKPKKQNTTGGHGGGGRDLSNVDIPTVLDAFIDEINDASDWDAVVRLLCRMFELPDMGTRSGLKRIHANFAEIQKNLDAAYTKHRDNDKVAGGVVGIWAGMCMDSLLRDKLFRAGLLGKMLPLFDRRATRHVGLQALCAVTHHGGTEIRQEIARQSPTLVRLMDEFPDDLRVNELSIVTLGHTISTVFNDDQSPQSVKNQTMKSVDVPAILRLVLRNLRKPESSIYLQAHAITLLSGIAEKCSRQIKAVPSLVSLLAACLRSKELSLRCSALCGMFALVLDEAVIDYGHIDPNKLIPAIQRGFPDDLSDIMIEYGFMQCDTYIILQASMQFQKAMQQCLQDRDLYALGIKLARLILLTEFSVTDGMYKAMNERTGQWETVDTGLPFQLWSDSLPHCARALRAKKTPDDEDNADILQCKFLIMRQRLPEALQLAKRAVERSPQVAYFYYVIGLCTKDPAEGLRSSKKGIKCKRTTPFVKRHLLWRAIEHAANMGLFKLQSSAAGDTAYSEGVAFLTSALDDAKMFVAEASPDSRHMAGILSWYMLLTIALKGPDLSVDLNELEDAFKKLEITQKFSKFFDNPQAPTQLRLTRELVLKHYKSGYKDWKPLVDHLDHGYATGDVQHRLTLKAEDNLSAWLEGLSLEDDEHTHGRTRCGHPKLSSNVVGLYQCSYCGNPSAALRKCSGCAKTKYCDPGCQKQHWPEHKVACKKAQAQSQAE